MGRGPPPILYGGYSYDSTSIRRLFDYLTEFIKVTVTRVVNG